MKTGGTSRNLFSKNVRFGLKPEIISSIAHSRIGTMLYDIVGCGGTLPTISYAGFSFRSDKWLNGCGGRIRSPMLLSNCNFVWVYRFMLFLMCKRSTIFCVNNKIIAGRNYKLVLPSQLDNNWFENIQDSNLKEIKLLYVGRIKIEKGIFSLLNLLEKINLNLPHSLTLVGHGKKISNLPNNVNLLSPVSKSSDLIKMYDNHNIVILPSFTLNAALR